MNRVSENFTQFFNIGGTIIEGRDSERLASVLIIDDGELLFEAFHNICDCLGISVQRIPSRDDLGAALRTRRPMAVVAEVDAAGQDGCHVLMAIAQHDSELPVLLLTGEDPAMIGAVDAVEEIWQLASVTKWQRLLGIGAVIDFLFQAGRKAGCMRLMSV
jgi:PleD family two-component response regulator